MSTAPVTDWGTALITLAVVRAERITVNRQVYERVQVSRREVVDQERIAATVRRQELRVGVDPNGASPVRHPDDERVAE